MGLRNDGENWHSSFRQTDRVTADGNQFHVRGIPRQRSGAQGPCLALPTGTSVSSRYQPVRARGSNGTKPCGSTELLVAIFADDGNGWEEREGG